jgi:hypothetical protein
LEEHFLKNQMEGEPEFKPEPWYNRHGDCVVYQGADEATYAERVDSILTLYRSADDGRVVGFQVKGVAAIMSKFGFDHVAIGAQTRGDNVVSVTMLLLAALSSGAELPTRHRLESYDAALRELPEVRGKKVNVCEAVCN